MNSYSSDENNMPNIKDISINILIIICVVVTESFLIWSSIPVTVLGIVLTPLMIIFLYYLIKNRFFEKNKNSTVSEVPRTSLTVSVSYLLFSLLLTSLGGWCVYAGLISPLGYFTGVKGAVHSYTLFLLGVVVIYLSIFIFLHE